MVVDEQQPRNSAPEAGVDESQPADHPHVVPERAHASRLVARSLQGRAKGRGDEARHEGDGDDRDHQAEVVERRRAVEIDAERRRPRQAAQAVVTVGHRHPAQCRSPEHLREREGQHQEAEAGGAQRDQAERRRHQRRADQRRRRGGEMPHAELQRHQGRKIGGDAKVGGVAERRQPAIAEQQVDARGEHREDEDLARQVDVVLARHKRKQNQKYQK